MFDDHANFSYSTVATAPSPATSGLALTVQSGDGSHFPGSPFNIAVWPAGVQPLRSNCEICRVTNIAGDVFTIVRAQESTSAISITVGMQVANVATRKVFTDIEAAINALAAPPFYGDGSDGVVTFDSISTFAFASKSGSTYTLTRDVMAASITVNGGVTLNTGGFRIFCLGTFDNEGTVQNNGGNASGTTAGTAAPGGTLGGGGAGAAGVASGTTTVAGNAAANTNAAYASLGAAGGAGGNAGGAAGTISTPARIPTFRDLCSALGMGWVPPAAVNTTAPGTAVVPCGGTGGGSGKRTTNTTATATGAGGGGGGLILIITQIFLNNGTIQCLGGNGGNAAGAGNCVSGGGGGGGGGAITLIANSFSNGLGILSVAGGSVGTGLNAASAAAAGSSGTTIDFT